MIYINGSEELKGQLSTYDITDNLDNAHCAVLEMPGNKELLNQIAGTIPVFVVVTSMMSFADIKATRQAGVEMVQQIEGLHNLIQPYLAPTTTTTDEDDDFLILDDDEDDFMIIDDDAEDHTPTKPVVKTNLQHNPPVTMAEPTQPPPKPSGHDRKGNMLQRPSRKSAIAVSFSSEGGVGKTFVASNVAALAAMSGISTVAVDMDLGYGDLDTAVGLVDPKIRDKVIDKKAHVPPNGWATVADWRPYAVNLKQNLLKHNSGLYVMPAYPYAGDDISQSEIEDLLYNLSEAFEFIVVDLGVDGFSSHARAALKMADEIMLIGGQSEKTIGKLAHFLKQEGGYNSSKMHLAINQVSPMGYYTPKEVTNKLGFDTHYEIPLDKPGVNAAKKRRKLPVQLPKSQAGDAIKQYAAAVLPLDLATPSIQSVVAKTSIIDKFKNLFSRR